MWITVDLHDACGPWHSARSDAFWWLSLRRMAESMIPAGQTAATGTEPVGPLGAAVGALTTTIAVSVPVFLVGGLAVQISDELGFTPAGLGLAVSAYFGASALSSVPAGAVVERYGSRTVSRFAIGVAAAALLGIAVGAQALWSLIAVLVLGAAANALGQLASNSSLAEHVPARRQGLSFGVKQAAIPVCTLLAGAAVPAVALTLGWRWAFVLAAALAVAAIPLVRGENDGHRRARGPAGDRATAALVVIGVA